MDRDRSNIIIWFAAGALVGAAVALFVAPETGARTRRDFAEKTQRGGKSIFSAGQELFDRGRELYERGREIAEDAAEMFERGRRIAEKNIDERI